MKKKYIIFLLIPVLFSCTKLDEDVRSQISDEYLNTPAGFQEGINSAYNSLRGWYGQQNGGFLTVFGTDEYTYGGALQGFDAYTIDINPTASTIVGPWNSMYAAINTCNAVIDRADIVPMDESLKKIRLGEARFLRAHYYFLLVQMYGPVHLTLHQTEGAARVAKRSPVADVYNAIIEDLTYAVANLQPTSPDWGRATLPAAKHALAKVYLTRGYTAAKQPGDFANAARLAKEVIETPGGPKLLDDFGALFEKQGPSEKNSEILFSVQYSIDPVTNSGGNKTHLYFNCAYNSQSGMVLDIPNGRVFAHYRPTPYMLGLYNKTIDSRFDKTFRTVWYVNKPGNFAVNKDIVPNKMVNMKLRDTAFIIVDEEWTPEQRNSKNYTVIPPSKMIRGVNGGGSFETVYPVNAKFYDSLRLDANSQDGSRDFYVFRLAETYLIAAEALLMDGKPADAVPFLNTLRRRAAKTGATSTITEANKAAMEITAGQVTLDFILDERARELSGEYMRWFDLVRTGKLIERVKLYNATAVPNIKDYHVLRPIPQEQIDRTDGGKAVFPQNDGYN